MAGDQVELAFRPFQLADAEALLGWANTSDELLQWSGPRFSFPLDREQLRAYAETASDRRHIVSGVVRETGLVVAHAELTVLPEHEVGEVRRVAVAPSMRARGVGGALMHWLVSFGFDELGLHRLELVVFSFNEYARRCYEKAGFREEGCAREARKASTGYWDLIYMAQLAGRRTRRS